MPAPIVGGEEAANGEYPAQGALFINLNNSPAFEGLCGGTLVGSRFFLTAAHCVDSGNGTPLSANRFRVVLGTNDISGGIDAIPVQNQYGVVAVEENAFDPDTFVNDTAMLKLAAPAPYQPLRVIGNAAAIWAPGTSARIIGWGTTTQGGGGSISTRLREADVPIVSDADCLAAYGVEFDAGTMICAYDGTHDTCQGDSGGPLMVSDGSGFVLVGITSWGIGCADPGFPGVYARVGAPAVNSWVRARFPWAAFTSGSATAGQPVTFTSTSFHPEGVGGFSDFNWDFDNDGVFDDATGATVAHTFSTAGAYSIGLEASKPGADRAEARRNVIVVAAPSPPPPPPAEPPPPSPPPTSPPPPPSPPVAPPSPAPRVVRCVVPRLRGRTLAGARAALARAHCRLGPVTRSYSTTVRPGRVVRQRPASGARKLRGTRVSVVLSRGKQKR